VRGKGGHKIGERLIERSKEGEEGNEELRKRGKE
jgi:hypothetical protein